MNKQFCFKWPVNPYAARVYGLFMILIRHVKKYERVIRILWDGSGRKEAGNGGLAGGVRQKRKRAGRGFRRKIYRMETHSAGKFCILYDE